MLMCIIELTTLHYNCLVKFPSLESRAWAMSLMPTARTFHLLWLAHWNWSITVGGYDIASRKWHFLMIALLWWIRALIAELENLEFYIFANDFLLPDDPFLTFLLSIGNNVDQAVYKCSHFIPLPQMCSSIKNSFLARFQLFSLFSPLLSYSVPSSSSISPMGIKPG